MATKPVPFQQKFKSISNQKVKNILQQGAEQLRPLAQKKIIKVKKRWGYCKIKKNRTDKTGPILL